MQHIDIRIDGQRRGQRLSPETFDITDLEALLPIVRKLVHASTDKNRGVITYTPAEGSMVMKIGFGIYQTFMMASTIIAHVASGYSLVGLNPDTADAILALQRESRRMGVNIELYAGEMSDTTPRVTITPTTSFEYNDNVWVETETYLYGTVTTMGGKTNPSIQIDVRGRGRPLLIETSTEFLSELRENIVYRDMGVRATARINIATGELDPKSLRLVELVNYNPVYDPEYLQRLIAIGTQQWAGIDADEFVASIRYSD